MSLICSQRLIWCSEITFASPGNLGSGPCTAPHVTRILLPRLSHTGRCRVATLPTETPVLPDEKLGTASSSGNLLQAGCLLWGFFLYFVAVWDFWHDFSTIFFQANSETRHGKSEWFVHVKSLWSLLEQLERFCDLDQKPVRWQGKTFVFWPLQNTPPKDDQITNLWKNK